MRFFLQSLRLALDERTAQEGNESHCMAKDLCLFLQHVGLQDVITDLNLESVKLEAEQVSTLWSRLKHFSQGAKIRLTAYTGVASTRSVRAGRVCGFDFRHM